MDPEVKEEGDFDVEAGVADIAAGLGFGDEPEEIVEDAAPVVAEPAVVETPVRTPPKSWAKEKHEVWSKLAPEAQEQIELREKQMLDGLEGYKADSGFGKSMRETITPYKAMLAAQGVDEVKAVSVLMNAHYKLSTLPVEDRKAYFSSLARNYGIDLGLEQQPPADPRFRSLEDQVSKLTNTLTETQTRAYEETRAKVTNDVTSFADAKDDKGNKVHPYFDEVADDIIVFLNAGKDLQEAYERAVRANPVTYAKESARLQTEAQAQSRAKSKQEANAALKARSANVRSRDTTRAPTEPLGKMDDTMKETLAEIRARSH